MELRKLRFLSILEIIEPVNTLSEVKYQLVHTIGIVTNHLAA